MTNEHSCPICQSRELQAIVKRTHTPVHQNLIYSSHEKARRALTGTLDLVLCKSCEFVFNRSFDLNLLSYGKDYDNCQSHSACFETYLDNIVQCLVEEYGMRDSVIVEVGCGNGSFIKKCLDYAGANNTGYGFDPSYNGPLSVCNGKLQFVQSFYDKNCAQIQADFVVSRHVIEHVPNPMELLKSVRAAMSNSPHARLYFETPCVDWILKNQVIWDFFYEHCSLFSPKSLRLAFEYAGFEVEKIAHSFGGQYLWVVAKVASRPKRTELLSDTQWFANAYTAKEKELKSQWHTFIENLKKKGNVAVWGAGAKGVTLVNLIDSSQTLVECLVDINPAKQNQYVAGTGHAIVGPQSLKDFDIQYIINMNPNYLAEIQKQLDALKSEAQIIEWGLT